jgi:hypothetical protein
MKERRENDAYYTPPWMVRLLLKYWEPPNTEGIWVEPAVGTGNIVRAMNEKYPNAEWRGYDIDLPSGVHQIANLRAKHHDFFLVHEPCSRASLAMSNFPFSTAQAFLERTRFMYPNAYIMVLLRLGFLASKERSTIWPTYGEPDLFTFANRGSFTEDGKTDKYDYIGFPTTADHSLTPATIMAWYGWPARPRKVGALVHLPHVELEERQRGF